MLQNILLVCALALDAFAVSVSYGVKGIAISRLPSLVIAFIGTIVFANSVLLAYIFRMFIPDNACASVGAVILLILGINSMFQCLLKSYLRKRENYSKDFSFKISDISIMLDIYLDETKADLDNSKTLSCNEAMLLGITLSLDSLATGFGSGLMPMDYRVVLISLFIVQFLAVRFGFMLGDRLKKQLKYDISWVGGFMLVVLAFIKLRSV